LHVDAANAARAAPGDAPQQYLARGITADNDENLTFTAAVTGSYYLVVKMYRDGGAAQVGNLYDLVVGVQ
jgi:hypothetical protein